MRTTRLGGYQEGSLSIHPHCCYSLSGLTLEWERSITVTSGIVWPSQRTDVYREPSAFKHVFEAETLTSLQRLFVLSESKERTQLVHCNNGIRSTDIPCRFRAVRFCPSDESTLSIAWGNGTYL